MSAGHSPGVMANRRRAHYSPGVIANRRSAARRGGGAAIQVFAFAVLSAARRPRRASANGAPHPSLGRSPRTVHCKTPEG